MIKNFLILLIVTYICYSVLIYCKGTSNSPQENITLIASKGFTVWQQKNCQSCHQLYGLGGYMGPDLTNIMSDSLKGEPYARAFMTNGGAKMPNLKLHADEINDLIAFLKWVDKSGHSRVEEKDVTKYGNYLIKN